jgi:hypothetical protein
LTTKEGDTFDTKPALASLRAQGKALIDIADALEGCTRDECLRVLRASAFLLDIDPACVGLQEIKR